MARRPDTSRGGSGRRRTPDRTRDAEDGREEQEASGAASERPQDPPPWASASIRPGWASFAEATTAGEVLADLDAQLGTRRQTTEGPTGHNGPDDATTSEATPVADDPRDRAANEPVQYDDEPWQGDDTQLAFFADPGRSGAPAEDADHRDADHEDADHGEPAIDGTVQLSVRDILAKREAGEPLDLPERAAPAESPAAEPPEDSLTAAFAAAAEEQVEDDPDATAFYDWTIEDLDDEAPHPGSDAHARPDGSDAATPGPTTPDSGPVAPEAVAPSAIVPGAPLLGVVPDLHPSEDDGPSVEPEDAGEPPRRVLGRFPVEGDDADEPPAPVPPVAAGPAVVAVPDLDPGTDRDPDEDDPDAFDSGDEYASHDGYERDDEDEDGEEDASDRSEDEDAYADEPPADHAHGDEEATIVVPLPQEVSPDPDDLPDDADPDGDPDGDAAGEQADERDSDTQAPQDEDDLEDGAALATDSWGPHPPGTQEEQFWHDDEGLRWRSRDGGYIWFADDGQIWDAQNGEVLRDALTASPAVAAAAVSAPEPEPVTDTTSDDDEDPVAPEVDPDATATMGRTEEPPPTVASPAAAEARRTREPAATGRSRRTTEPEIPDYVEYSPSGTRRRILAALWIAASVLAVVTIVWAVSSGSQSARGVAITVTGLALGSWWLLLSWAPTTVALAGSTLRVSKGRETEEFDLHDPDLAIELGDDVDSRGWKAIVTRPDGSELEIPATSVHPDEFVRVVRHHRRRM